MLKPMMFKMLETITQEKKAIPCTIPDSISNPLSAPGVILQLEFIHLLQNDFYIHYLHFMQRRLVKQRITQRLK